MTIKIISLKDRFRRCGVEHPSKPVVYPDNKFTKEQLEKLKAEPMLVVEVVKEEKKPNGDKGGSSNPGNGNGKDDK
ncbi:HI1506-related protein [Desulfotruncus alcoholivorax]|uniref:HI1506-related protein n=1 Tax=Desulfotruncus alcoholivorax TaxID=265477 RepID=UPI0004086289|nr:HI1506-related protein [Desulfotruncus alcoholivorax]